MQYSPAEQVWIERRAREIAEETGWALPIALSAAMAELDSEKPKAGVVPLHQAR